MCGFLTILARPGYQKYINDIDFIRKWVSLDPLQLFTSSCLMSPDRVWHPFPLVLSFMLITPGSIPWWILANGYTSVTIFGKGLWRPTHRGLNQQYWPTLRTYSSGVAI